MTDFASKTWRGHRSGCPLHPQVVEAGLGAELQSNSKTDPVHLQRVASLIVGAQLQTLILVVGH